MKKQAAYTLIEVLIALMIFAILASISTYSLKNILTRYRDLQQNYKKWHQIDAVIQNLQNQTYYFVRRNMKADGGHKFPVFIGQHDYVEWTYAKDHEELQRIAYRCQNNQLIQRKWTTLDPLQREQTRDQVLLTGLSSCQFRYLNSDHQTNGYWSTEYGPNPIGIQLLIGFSDKEKIQLWYALPPYRYDIQPT